MGLGQTEKGMEHLCFAAQVQGPQMRVSGLTHLPFCGELLMSSGLAGFASGLCVPTSRQDNFSPFHRVGVGYIILLIFISSYLTRGGLVWTSE